MLVKFVMDKKTNIHMSRKATANPNKDLLLMLILHPIQNRHFQRLYE